MRVNLLPQTLTQKQKESYDNAYILAPKIQKEIEELETQLQSYEEELASIEI